MTSVDIKRWDNLKWYHEFKFSFLLIIGVLSISFVSLSGCTKEALVVPDFEEPRPPPAEVTVQQLSSEYFADEVAANTRYRGERFLFNQIEVDEVGFYQFYQGGGQSTSYITYFKCGNVKFKTQDLSLIQNIETGYIMNIEGIILGLADLLKDTVTVEICWMESVKGDIGPEEVYIY
jgi:hypothetical protein